MTSRSPLLILALAAPFVSSGCRDEKIAAYRVPKEIPPAVAAPAATTQPDMAATAVKTAADGDLVWTAPARWQSLPASQMRKATLIIPGDSADQQGELAVTAFPGSVGGNLANLNRWRRQLRLEPVSADQLDAAFIRMDVGDLHIDVAELLGTVPADGRPRQRVLGAIVPFNGATWFFKLAGPDALVAREKDAFLSFVRTIRPAH